MLLRASGEMEEGGVQVGAVTGGTREADASGVPHAALLVGFAEALVTRDEAELTRLRGALIEALGPVGMRETASIASNFQRMVRIADGTGIPQDAPVRAMAADLVDELDLRQFASSARTPKTGRIGRLLGGVLRRAAPMLARRMAGRASR